MLADRPTQNDDNSRCKPFQFTLRLAIWMMTLTAIYLSILVAGPNWLAGLAEILLSMAVPAVLTIVLIHEYGYTRTFCIGALFPAGILILGGSGRYVDTAPRTVLEWLSSHQSTHTVLHADRLLDLTNMTLHFLVILAFGLLAIMVRRMVEPRPSAPEGRPEEPACDDPQSPIA